MLLEFMDHLVHVTLHLVFQTIRLVSPTVPDQQPHHYAKRWAYPA